MEYRCEVVRIEKLEDHPDADTLQVTAAWSYPVIVKKGEFNLGDLAIYIPIDGVVPFTEEWRWLHGGSERVKDRRIKAKRLRGIFSMGLLVPTYYLMPTEPVGPDVDNLLKSVLVEGSDVTILLGVTKYEPPIHLSHGNHYVQPVGFNRYTDVENLLRWDRNWTLGEPIVVTEKVHGMNFRAGWLDGQFLIGSHNRCRSRPENLEDDIFWKMADKYQLEHKLSFFPNVVLYGELYGSGVQDLTYGCAPNEQKLIFFDVCEAKNSDGLWWPTYKDAWVGLQFIEDLGLPGPYVFSEDKFDMEVLKGLATGQTLMGGDHIREGIVVKPIHERSHPKGGRFCFKLLNPDYLIRKRGTEFK